MEEEANAPSFVSRLVPPQIMIVEDEEKYIRGLTEKLEKAGFSVVSARNSHEAAAKLRQYRSSLQLLLMDIEIDKPDHDHKYLDGFDWVTQECAYLTRRPGDTFPKFMFISGDEVLPDSHLGAITHPLRAVNWQEMPVQMVKGVKKERPSVKLSPEEADAVREGFFDRVVEAAKNHVNMTPPEQSIAL